MMRVVLIIVAMLALRPGRRRVDRSVAPRASRAVLSSPPTTPGTSGSTRSRSPPDSDRDRRGDRGRRPHACGLRLWSLGRRPDRDPGHRRRHEDAALAGGVRVRRRVRPRPVPDPGGRADRGWRRTADGDRHAILVDRDRCRLYELFALRRVGSRWTAGSGAVWDLRSNRLATRRVDVRRRRGARDPSRARAVRGGRAREHPARAALDRVAGRRRAYVWPARHFASSLTDASLPPMGLRLRLKRSFDISGFPRQARIVLTALREYGMLVADNGSDWYVSGAPHPKWSNDDLHSLHRVPGSAFEVVDTSSLR